MEVNLGTQAAAQSLRVYESPTSGVMHPGDRRASRVEVISDDLVQQVLMSKVGEGARPQVMVKVTVVADSSDGEIESLPFFFPIDLCNGCLVRKYNSCAEAQQYESNSCGLPQDSPVACCTDPSGELMCLAGTK